MFDGPTGSKYRKFYVIGKCIFHGLKVKIQWLSSSSAHFKYF